MACLAYTWKQVVGTELFAENDLALKVGSGEGAITVVRLPARYSSFDAAAIGSSAGRRPTQRRVSQRTATRVVKIRA